MLSAVGAVSRAVAILVAVLAGLAGFCCVAVVAAGAAEGVRALLSGMPAVWSRQEVASFWGG